MFYFQSHFHLNVPFFKHSKDYFYLFLSKVIRSLTESSVFFYLSIFLFQLESKITVNWLGFDNLSILQRGIIVIAGYMFLVNFFRLLFTFKIIDFVKKIGLRNGMILGTLFYIVGFVSFLGIDMSWLFFMVSAVAMALGGQLYWPAYRSVFSKTMDHQKSGGDISSLEFFSKLANAGMPLLAGVLFAQNSYQSVVLLSCVFFLLSIVTLLKMTNTKVKDKISLSEFVLWIKEKRFQKLSVAFAGREGADLVMFLWPLYVLSIVGTIQKVGYIYSLVLFFSLLIIYFSGWYIDHKKSKKPFYVTGLVRSLLWVGRSLTVGVWGIIVVDTIEQLVSSFYVPFFDTTYIKRSKGREVLSFFTYREIILSFARIFFYPLVAIAFFFDYSWVILFGVASVGMLLSLLLEEKHPQ